MLIWVFQTDQQIINDTYQRKITGDGVMKKRDHSCIHLFIYIFILQVVLVNQVLQGLLVPQVLLVLKVNTEMGRESLANWLGVNEHSSLPVSLVLLCSNQKSELMASFEIKFILLGTHNLYSNKFLETSSENGDRQGGFLKNESLRCVMFPAVFSLLSKIR